MREKYIFLIGFGVGIVMTCVIGFFSYNMTLKPVAKEEVKIESIITTEETSEVLTESQTEIETETETETLSIEMELTTKADTKQIKAKKIII